MPKRAESWAYMNRLGRVMVVVGALLMIAGCFLPWELATSGEVVVLPLGPDPRFETPDPGSGVIVGWIVIPLACAILVGAILWTRWARGSATFAGLAIAAGTLIKLWPLRHDANRFSDVPQLQAGIGGPVIIVGAIAVLIGGAIGWNSEENAHPTRDNQG